MVHRIFLITLISAALAAMPCRAAKPEAWKTAGKVLDEHGEPVAAAIVESEFGGCMAFTDSAGAFSLVVDDGSAFAEIVSEGYCTAKVLRERGGGEDAEKEIRLVPDTYRQYGVIDYGFLPKRKTEVAGSYASVAGAELAKSPVSNLGSTFTGRLPGLTMIESSSEWARISNTMAVRGVNGSWSRAPIVILDGFMLPLNAYQSYESISPHDIESVSILKDVSLMALYGIRGVDGALVINTRRGRPGKPAIEVHIDGSMQEFTTTPYRTNSAVYARLRNEAAYNDLPGNGRFQWFTEEMMAKFASGSDPVHYPSHDWYREFLKKYAYMERAGINITGGNDKVNFFSSINMMHQNTHFITQENPKFDPTPRYVWVNLRTNVDMKLGRYFKAYVSIAGSTKREKTTDNSMASTYAGVFDLPPTLYGNLTPEVADPQTGEVVTPAGKMLTSLNLGSKDNVYGRLNMQGFVRHTATNVYSNFGLELDMRFITRGLKAFGSVGFQAYNVKSLNVKQTYERWYRVLESPADWDELRFMKWGTEEDGFLRYSEYGDDYHTFNTRGGLKYERSFGRHSVSAIGYAMYQTTASSWERLPWKYIYSGAELNYSYAGRYVLTLNSGYSGSDQFAPGNRFHATPSVSAAWIVTNEAFLGDVRWLSLLKLRASFGWNGNDQDGMPRYPYLGNISGVNEISTANPGYEPEMHRRWNFGLELGVLKGLYVSADIFKSRTDNMIQNDSSLIPSYHGSVGSNFPQRNSAGFENRGWEIEASYSKNITRELYFTVGGYAAFNENRYISKTDAERSDDYVYAQRLNGFPVGQGWGYLVDYGNGNGFFNSEEELREYTAEITSFMPPRVGDLKYRDLNGDGEIDDKDQAPLGKGSLPRLTYAFNVGAKWRNFDFSVLFQGIGRYEQSIAGAVGVNEAYFTDGLYTSRHLNAWTAERYAAGETITHPALTGAQANHNSVTSDYWMIDKSYLRLKNAEIGYTLPRRPPQEGKSEPPTIRFTLSGQNLLTFDRLDGCDFGPENSALNAIPVMRVYSAGAHIRF